MDFYGFSEPQGVPGTSKINEKPKVFVCFLLLSHVALDNKKSTKNVLKSFQGSFQDSPKSFQDQLKTHQDGPKTPPRRSLDAPRCIPGAPGRTKTAPDTCKPTNMPHRPFQNSIFERPGGQNLKVLPKFLARLLDPKRLQNTTTQPLVE